MEFALRLPRRGKDSRGDAADAAAVAAVAAATATAATAAPSPTPLATVKAPPEPYVLGVDEAGRGPVLGPMVYACAFWPLALDADMKTRGFDDSKKLSEAERERLFELIKRDADVGFAVVSISAAEISKQMLRALPTSLNRIAHDATVDMIHRVLRAGVDVREVYVDAVGDCDSYERVLSQAFPRCKFTVRPKADSLFKCVSAASIVAKVTRDKQLREWSFEEAGLNPGTDWGCGYPSDERTKRWLAENIDPVFGFPSVVRMSWATSRHLLEGKSPSAAGGGGGADGGDDAEADAAEAAGGADAKAVKVVFPSDVTRPGSQSISSMFSRASSKRVHYLSSRGVESVPLATALP